MLTLRDNSGNSVIEVYDSRYDSQMSYVATHLRQEDFDEVFAATGDSPHYAIFQGWDTSSKRFMIFDRYGNPAAVVGVNPVEEYSRIGVIWLLGTDRLNKMKKFFIKISKPIIRELSVGYDILVNYVDSRYTKTIRWLLWCGFTVEAADTADGKFSVPFHKVYLEVR